jgi:hypothetical protein
VRLQKYAKKNEKTTNRKRFDLPRLFQILLELSPVFGTEVFKLPFLTILKKGRLDEDDLTMSVTAELNSPEAQSDFWGRRPEDILAILKKHPVAYENTKKYAGRAREKMDKLDSLFD